MNLRSVLFTSLFASAAACGTSPNASQTQSELFASEVECDESVPLAVCEGVNFLTHALASNSAVSGIGMSLNAQQIVIQIQAFDQDDFRMKKAMIVQSLLELKLSGSDKISFQNGGTFYRATNGTQARVVFEDLGAITPNVL
jgi:tRNA threonylcarbamoyladenosine modification (KEOPS) complex  Pcc1 subunit